MLDRSDMPSALVIGHADSRSALAGVRALARAGWRVDMGSPSPEGLAAASRHVTRWHHVPAPEVDLDAFVAAVNRAMASDPAEIVLASGDQDMTAVSQRRADLDVLVPYAPHEAVMRALDKLELARAAARVGLPAPRTVEPTAEALAAWDGPAVVKPRFHSPLEREGPLAHLAVRRVSDPAHARAAADALRRAGGEPLLQEPIDHGHLAFVAVRDGASGEIVACLQQRSLRLYPPDAGISARAVTEPVDESLLAGVAALLEELGWSGLAQLQFRIDADGAPRLIDFNGRLYGSLALAARAGLNLPATWADVALGRFRGPPARGASGARYQWLEGDLRTSGRRPGELAETLAFGLRAGHSIWDPRDPGPALRYAGRVPRRLLGRALGACAPGLRGR